MKIENKLLLAIPLLLAMSCSWAIDFSYQTQNYLPYQLTLVENNSTSAPPPNPPLNIPAGGTSSPAKGDEIRIVSTFGVSGNFKYAVSGKPELGYCDIHYKYYLDTDLQYHYVDSVYVDPNNRTIYCTILNNVITFQCVTNPPFKC